MDIETILITLAIVFGVTIVSMVLHELMHGVTAYLLGDSTAKDSGRLTLNPIKHIDPFLTVILPMIMAVTGMPIFGGAKPVPFNPNRVKGAEWGAALVGIVGPLTNLVLAFISYLFLLFFHGQLGDSIIKTIFEYSVTVNLGFFAFNILPIPPLDGSRVLYAVAPNPVQRAMEFIERMGLVIVFAVVLFASPIISKIIFAINFAILSGFDAIGSVLTGSML